MTLQAALAAVLLVGLPVLLLALGVLAHAYYVARPRNAQRADQLIEELVADSVEQLIARLRTLDPPATRPAEPSVALPRPPHAFAALLPPVAPLALAAPPAANLRAAVLQLLTEGLSDRSIARRLGVGIEEVRAARVAASPQRRAA